LADQLERMRKRALRDGKVVAVADCVLVIDGVTVFSLQQGFVRRSANVHAGNVVLCANDG